MSEDSIYQQLRGHLGVLRLAAAAEALPGELDYATKNKLGHSAFLNRLLEVEVIATESPPARQPGTFCPSARPLADRRLRLRRPAVGGQEDGP